MSKAARLAAALLAALPLAPAASAQTLAELQLVAALSAELNPALSLPRGSYRAVGGNLEGFIRQVPGHEAFGDWEVYAASGLAANLQGAFVGRITASFAVNGYVLSEELERVGGGETHTRYLYADASGGAALLYTIRRPGDLVYLIGQGR